MTNKENISWVSKNEIHEKIRDYIKSSSTVMDVGCGIRPQSFIFPNNLICIEPFYEYAKILQRYFEGTNTTIICSEALDACRIIPSRSVDTIFFLDVIEHMPKEIGSQVLRELERIARKQIVVFTPLGYMPQRVHEEKIDRWNLNGGEWQEHKSGWTPEDFPDWEIVACKHLHVDDFSEETKQTEYGGFYAIKNIKKHEDIFNSYYGEEVLKEGLQNIRDYTSDFPILDSNVFNIESNRSKIKASILTLSKLTEVFISSAKTKSNEEIYTEIAKYHNGLHIQEYDVFINKLRQFVSLFSEVNNYRSTIKEISQKNTELNNELNKRTFYSILKTIWKKLKGYS